VSITLSLGSPILSVILSKIDLESFLVSVQKI
jgi:hypothetical protein